MRILRVTGWCFMSAAALTLAVYGCSGDDDGGGHADAGDESVVDSGDGGGDDVGDAGECLPKGAPCTNVMACCAHSCELNALEDASAGSVCK
jgi:hypothetical protein